MSEEKCVLKLEYGNFIVKLSLIPIRLVKPHEEVVEEMLDSLLRKMIKVGSLWDPLIVDESTYVVLDGMHRLEALKRIKAKYVPTCLVNYADDNIILKRWFRVISFNDDLVKYLMHYANINNLKVSKVTFSIANEMVISREAYFAIHSNKGSYVISGDDASCSFRAYQILYSFENFLKNNGALIDYVKEDEALNIFFKEMKPIIVTQKVRKDEVIKNALEGRLYAPKSTRHIIPIRPVGINMPLELLTYPLNNNEIRKLFVKILSSRKVKIIKSRKLRYKKYDELLLTFT